MGKYKELAEKILIYMGGAENISKVAHCATRLRLTYKDKNKIQVEDLKKIPGVSGIVQKAGVIQVIIGPNVHDVYNDFVEVSGWKPQEDDFIDVVEDDETEKYKLVTSIRGNSMENRISIESPIGKALKGHKVGDRVEVKVNDSYSYFLEIRSIDKTHTEDEEIRGF